MVGFIPNVNLFEAQHSDPGISKVLELKEHHFPKPPLFVWKSNKKFALLLELLG